VDEDGMVYVADRQDGRVQRFDQTGKYLGEWTNLGMVTTVAIGGGGAMDRNSAAQRTHQRDGMAHENRSALRKDSRPHRLRTQPSRGERHCQRRSTVRRKAGYGTVVPPGAMNRQ
jgi:hypothetical protein